jgi:hypothetical protein
MKNTINILLQVILKNLNSVLFSILLIEIYSPPLYSQKLCPQTINAAFSEKGPQQMHSFRISTSINEDIYYLDADLAFQLDNKLNIQAVFGFYFTPQENKILKFDTQDVYLNLNESRYVLLLMFEKTFWFNNTLGAYISAGGGWTWYSYAGSNQDDNNPVVPALNTGVDINFSKNLESGFSYGMRIGYELLNFKSETNHLGFLSLIFRF